METMKVETITPETAIKLLETSKFNRGIISGNLKFLCQQLQSGQWKINGQPIIISTEGELLDGQHRLQAVVKTGISIKTAVIRGIEKNAFITMDSGKPRRFSDVLSIQQEKYAFQLASTIRMYDDIIHRNGVWVSTKVSNETMLKILNDNPLIRKSVEYVVQSGIKKFNKTLLSSMHYIFSKCDKDNADYFFNKLNLGTGLTKESPIYVLREKLMQLPPLRHRTDNMFIAAIYIKSWNAHMTGKEIKVLSYRISSDNPEAFPEIWGWKYNAK